MIRVGGYNGASGAYTLSVGNTDCPPPSPCGCDWNNDSALNSQDFFDFLTAFFASSADYNADGSTTSQDFFDFLSCFSRVARNGGPAPQLHRPGHEALRMQPSRPAAGGLFSLAAPRGKAPIPNEKPAPRGAGGERIHVEQQGALHAAGEEAGQEVEEVLAVRRAGLVEVRVAREEGGQEVEEVLAVQ